MIFSSLINRPNMRSSEPQEGPSAGRQDILHEPNNYCHQHQEELQIQGIPVEIQEYGLQTCGTFQNPTDECVCELETLPDLVIRKIVSYLSAGDLAALSAVSRALRDRLNQDSLWKPFCNQRVAQYLNKQECQVEPKFVVPVIQDSELNDVCAMRLAFMRQIHLWNNWRNGNFTRTYVLAAKSFNWSFIDDNVIVSTYDGYSEIWDVEKKPVQIKHRLDGLCKVSNDKIVLSKNNRVKIYQIESKFKRIELLNSFETCEDVDFLDGFCLLTDIFFVNISHDKCTLTFRNINTGTIKEVKRNSTVFLGLYEQRTFDDSYLLVSCCDADDEKITFSLIYSTDTTEIFQSYHYYNDTYQTFVVKDEVFINRMPREIDIYNLRTGQLASTVDVGSMPFISPSNLSDNLMFRSGKELYTSVVAAFRNANILNLSPLDEKYFFSVNYYGFPILAEWKNEKIVNRHLLPEIGPLFGHFAFNRSYTKLACRNKRYGEVITFW